MEIQSGKLDLYKPIPLEVPPVTGWKEIPLKDNGEPLEAIGPFSGNKYDRVFTSSIYFGERDDSPYPRQSLEGSLVTTFARQEVAEQLIQAEESLPAGFHLGVFDSYRTLGVQQSLYESYLEKLRKQQSEWSDEKLSEETQRYISIPSTNPDRPSPHNTGGAIDVAIYKLPKEIETRVNEINQTISEIGHDQVQSAKVYELEMERIGLIAQNAEMLNFGTPWDWGGPEAGVSYLEKTAEERQLTQTEQEALQNRRLLYNAMTSAGLEPYIDEWWHYNSPKSQMGAKTAGLDHAEYGAAALSKANRQHEQMRLQHLKGSEVLASMQSMILNKFGQKNDLLELATRAAKKMGDMRETSLPVAATIEPPEEKAA